MDPEGIVADLKKERDRIGRAITLLVESYCLFAVKKTKAIATRRLETKRKKRGGIKPLGKEAVVAGDEERLGRTQEKEAVATGTYEID